jgi:arylsulfatase A-like enzyme
VAAKPNIVLIVTDQQRAPMHWPDQPGWMRELMPNDHALAQTGLTFERGFTNTCMCSPSRATLFTGLYPERHKVTLTLTHGGAPLQRLAILPDVLRTLGSAMMRPGLPRDEYLRAFKRGSMQKPADPDLEPILDPSLMTMPRMLKQAGYNIAYKGKWHLTKPVGGGEWHGRADAKLISDHYDFDGWQPPDAGEDITAERFGGGNAGFSSRGWDEEYTRQVETFLSSPPEPFALIVSLVNPHDVLAYPRSFTEGGYTVDEFADIEVPLPETYDELLTNKPSAHALMNMGQAAYIGAIKNEQKAREYLSFYAYLHKLVDEKIGRIVDALGSAGDPNSMRARTLVVRASDHGEMGLAHGGLRQKMFNAYEETLRVPLVVSNPALFPKPKTTQAFGALIDLMPTLASVAGATPPDDLQGVDLSPVIAGAVEPNGLMAAANVDFDGITKAKPAPSVQDQVRFTYDDHKAATDRADVTAPPNRIRCVRTAAHKYAVYFDPEGRAPSQYELYDLERDPIERRNLVNVHTGEPLEDGDRPARDELAERLGPL